ncbi:L-histidine N(alpha)-methyltransferase [Rhodoblastus sp.]|uniref:L-histidine N(alpha)-methyltransferase n=1 Tax=Rhodoblastus sp. TaxID=1962975 RepID=UPI003F9E2A15
MAGIFDWDEKFTNIIEVLARGGSDIQIAAWVLGADSKFAADTKAAEELAGSFKSWSKHRPTGNQGKRFVDCLMVRLSELGCDPLVMRSAFLNSSYRDFLELFPPEKRIAFKAPRDNGCHGHSSSRVSNSDAFHPFWIHRQAPFERVKLDHGRIDQKFYYLSPDSAHSWRGMINAGQYRQYLDCTESLEFFLDDRTYWLDSIKRRGITNVVMLGAGAPLKDNAIINSILELDPNTTIHYTLVDISIYMLMESFQLIDSALIVQGRRDRIDLVPLICDFTNLQGASEMLRQDGNSIAWFLPGGTIGNLNEKLTFRSIAQQAKAGDILVLGAETRNSNEKIEKEELIKKYKHPAVRDFLATPLRAAWHELNLGVSLNEAIDNLTIDVVDGLAQGYSAVPGSAVVEIAIHANAQKVVLITSTRYAEEHLCEAARAFHFIHKTTFTSHRNKNYKQFVFQYVPE